jgi:hypothetical protein
LCISLLPLTWEIYSKNIAADPQKYGKVNHKYAASTSISSLRYHIENHHADEYVKVCEDKKWPMMLAKRRVAEDQNSRSLAVSTDASRPPFNAKNFLHALVKFIVADDQVRA